MACISYQQHETQDFPDPPDRLEQVQGLGIMLFGGVENGQLQIVQHAVIMRRSGRGPPRCFFGPRGR